jgi:uncharacterized protein
MSRSQIRRRPKPTLETSDPDRDPDVHHQRGSGRLVRPRSNAIRDVALPATKPLALSLRPSRDGVILPVRLTPKSARDEVVGLEAYAGECVLKARVRALPEAGRANAALEALIARWLKLPSSSVKVAHGGKSRLKQVAVQGDASALSRLIAARLVELVGKG